ncbi:MAG: amino acid ABC transporter substrate-binding protein [Methanobacteriota archaeon]|nr:MAG: amino acid ABC transporter substrate-binding protein [Euryarchaeota archaeon]
MKNLKAFAACLIVTAIFVVVGCQWAGGNKNGKTEQNEKNSIKIGAILPLTGKLSMMGEVEKKAMSLAEEDANREGLQQIQIRFEDSKGTAKDAVAAANKLINIDSVDLLITSTTGVSLATVPVAAEKKKNLIAFCMDPDIAKSSPYVMRFYIGINEEAKAINEYFKENQESIKHVGIVYAQVPALEKVVKNNYVPFLEGLNVNIPLIESYKIGESDFKTTVLKIKNAKLDHLIVLGYGFQYPQLFQELKQNNLLNELQIIGGWGFLYTQVDPVLLEGVLVSGPDYVFKNQEIAGDFYERYHEKFGTYPNFDAAFAYNVIYSVSKYLKKENFEKPIKDVFIQMDTLKGVVGTFRFTKDGAMIVSTGLGVYKDGRIVAFENDDKSETLPAKGEEAQ